jgi:uncharacterized protein YbcV (DUF1398 family)
MSKAIEILKSAQQQGMEIRPKVGGFPYFAETLRRAGVSRNVWTLPSCQSLFLTSEGPVAMQATPLVVGYADVPLFDRSGVVAALRADQSGESKFPEFLASSWKAGVVGFTVNFIGRTCTYYGAHGEEFLEEYPAVKV